MQRRNGKSLHHASMSVNILLKGEKVKGKVKGLQPSNYKSKQEVEGRKHLFLSFLSFFPFFSSPLRRVMKHPVEQSSFRQ